MPASTWLSGNFSQNQSRRAQHRKPATTTSRRRQTFQPSPDALETRLTLSLTTLASFTGTNGISPFGAVIMDSSGNLFGTTFRGGASSDGTVFELAHGSGAITTVASFNGNNGQGPLDALSLDSSGNLYGTTSGQRYGGPTSDGTVFEVAAATGTITTLASFSGTNGATPRGGVIMDSSGNLYGTTSQGGASNDGTVFELAHGSGTITTLASFNYTNGADPYDTLIMDSSRNLYGTTKGGGSHSAGTIFELAHGGGTITTLASLNFSSGGRWPQAGLVMDSNGNLYGTAPFGGASNIGLVFELAHGSGTITVLASFDGANGANPYGGLIMDSSGNLYGTTSFGGGSGDGTVFELARGSGTITTLASFNGTNGAGPYDALIMDSSGNLYGTTAGGGSQGAGTVFELPGAAAPTSVRKSSLPSSSRGSDQEIVFGLIDQQTGPRRKPEIGSAHAM
jgi:uncharacterized repeat protein (TIGR03803 family)